MVPRAEEESADSRLCAATSMDAVEAVGSTGFLRWRFCELCFCWMFFRFVARLCESQKISKGKGVGVDV